MKASITSHTIVRNEDRFIWFAIKSVLPFVDQMVIYDTGSTDSTVNIIKSFKSDKIIFEQKPAVNANQLIKYRQQQLDRTKTNWFLILDGDEVYWRASIKALKKAASISPKTYGFITKTVNCVGDIYHYQEDKAGRYQFGSYRGHYAIRLINRRVPGLHLAGTYPLEGYYDDQNKPFTEYVDRLSYVDAPYLHLTNLSRSTDSRQPVISREKKHELGNKFPSTFKYPEVFSANRPKLIPSPWYKQTLTDKTLSAFITPAKLIKRRFVK